MIFMGLITASIVLSATENSGEPYVEIKDAKNQYLLPLSAEEELHVFGPVGQTVIRVSGGGVRVVSSDCQDKICIAMGEVRDISGWIACLPNRVFIHVIGITGKEDKVDAGAF